MDPAVPVRNPHTSTANLLTWSESPDGGDPPAGGANPASSRRSLKPAGGITPVMFGAAVSEQEAEDLNKRKTCSGSKWKEMTGSGIFAAGENGESEFGDDASNPSNKTTVRMYQQAVSGISQISFGSGESVSPKKPSSMPEFAKQRELSGTLESEADATMKKQFSRAKNRELSGSDIFGPPPEVSARPLAARNLELRGNLEFAIPQPRSIHTSVKVSNPTGGPSNIMFSEEPVVESTKKIHNQKFQELTGNNIFKEDATPGSAEKPLSMAKLKEMSGNDIFADGKAASRDFLGGVRKPPGGESTIALV